MRNALLSYGAAIAVVACTASGSDETTHGPTYGDVDASTNDASTDADTAPPTDGTTPDSTSDSPFDAGAPAADASLDASPAPDASLDAAGDAAPDAPSCTSTAAVVAGSGSILAAVSATGGAWGSAATLVGSAGAQPAVAAYGSGFAAVVESATGALTSTTFTSTWSTPAAIGAATARDRPALATIGSALHLIYQDPTSYYFFHAVLSAGTWSPTADAVGSFGPSGPTVAAVGSDLVVSQAGMNGFLYDQTWNGSWQTANEHTDANVDNAIAPTIVALSGGTSDVLIVFVRSTTSDYHLMFTTRTSGTWSPAAEVYDMSGNIAYTTSPVSMAPLSGGRAVLIFRGGNMVPYFSTFDGTSSWSPPAAVVSATTTVSTVPAVATGVCGDDAIAAMVETNGDVDVTSLHGSTWTATTHLVSAMSYAGIATSP
jgi:hypothetical protein